MVVFVGKSHNSFWTKSRLIAKRSSAEPKRNARAGKKWRGLGRNAWRILNFTPATLPEYLEGRAGLTDARTAWQGEF